MEHGGLGFSVQKHPTKTSLILPWNSLAVLVYQSQAQECNASNNFSMEIQKFSITILYKYIKKLRIFN